MSRSGAPCAIDVQRPFEWSFVVETEGLRNLAATQRLWTPSSLLQYAVHHQVQDLLVRIAEDVAQHVIIVLAEDRTR